VDAILSARFPVVVCGGGVVLSGGEAELDRLARTLDLVVATSVSGQGSIAESHPNCLGVVGSNGGTPPTRILLEQADMVVFVGCRAGSVTTERWRAPKRETRVLHLDADPMAISANYPTEVAVVGDARLSLGAMNAELASRSAHTGFSGASKVAAAKQEKFEAFADLATSDARPIRPERVIRDLRSTLPDDANVVADPGTPCPYFSAYYDFPRAGRHFVTNRAHGALGYALPASVGAQIGRRNAQVVSVMGDGSFGFACGELETVKRLGLPITFVVFSNSEFGWIKAGQKSGFGERYFSVDFDRTDHAAVAEAFGVRAWRVSDPGELQASLTAAVEHDGPALVDVISQPLEDARAPVSEWVA
jgi:acetolactate synthase-1/2/3 large subunit